MSQIIQFFSPVLNYLSKVTNGPYYYEITRAKGGNSPGADWISKFYHAYETQVVHYWKCLNDRFNNVKLEHLWEDNWVRVLLLNGFERMINLRQGHSVLSSKLFTPSTNNIELSKALSFEGGFRGWFKGAFYNAIQFSGVFYPALYFSGGSYLKFSLAYLLFDFIMLPIDRLKTLSYSSLGTVREVVSNSHAFSGAFHKLAFNIPYLWALRTTVNDSCTAQKVLAWGSVALAYPLLTLKTQAQLNDQTIRSPFLPKLYAGVVPFILLNVLAQYSLKHLYTSSTKKKLEEGYEEAINLYDREKLYGTSN